MTFKTYILVIITLLIVIGTQVQAQLDTVCTGDVGIKYGVTPEDPNAFLQWNVDGGTIVANYGDSIEVDWGNTGGTYSISVQEISVGGCQGDWEYADVMVVPPPDIDLADAAICDGETYQIDVETGYASYLWQDGSIDDFYLASTQGDYSVEVIDENGCVNIGAMILTIHPRPIVDLGNDTTLCGRNLYQLVAGDGSDYYLWSNIQDDEFYSSDYYIDLNGGTPGLYTVVVDNDYGCSDTDTILISSCGFEIPNILTPGELDDHNDTWNIPGLEAYPNVVITVYSRWGNKVYESNGYNEEWDGTFEGKELPMDSYYYVIDLKDGSKPLSGTITIVR